MASSEFFGLKEVVEVRDKEGNLIDTLYNIPEDAAAFNKILDYDGMGYDLWVRPATQTELILFSRKASK